ncbi:sigma 54-interacting transcriptional regulator [Pendulispora brunnea]|uniref:Sigma 54-interacting transcriptional regulator n=1 Tax=Pendulispora brunnea TaxID=2905690 RepID=A0ABZ2KDT3_9BACT
MADFSNDANTKTQGGEHVGQAERFLRVFTARGSFDVVLGDGTWTVGRASDAHVRIDDSSVSRVHARLHIGAHVLLEDLGSANGTRAGGRVLEPRKPVLVTSGMSLEFGEALGVLREGRDRSPTMQSTQETGVRGDGSDEDRVLLRVARADLPVLIEGETGAGKDYTVQRLHARSRRATGPLVRASCALVRAGRLDLGECFDRAVAGTLILDEVTNLDAQGQALLVGVWESASEKTNPADMARVVSMSSVALEEAAAAGAFRPDLYYRLAHLTLRIPPLRERTDELIDIASAILAELTETPPLLSADAVRLLRGHAWPGNVRELRMALERALAFSNSRVLTASHFQGIEPRAVQPRRMSATPVADTAPSMNQSLKEAAEAAEYQRILEALRACSGNQTRAAKLLGISRGTLISRLQRYNVPRPRKL